MKTLALAAALALGAGTAFAGVLPFSDYTLQDVSDENDGTAFSKSFSLDLSAASWVSGSLKTGRNAIGSFLPSVDVQSVQLSGPGGSLAWNEVLASDPGSAGFEIWSFGTHWLEAGTWTLTVNGMAYSDKSEEGFRGEFIVPEPASAAVLSVALLGAAAARRRRRL